jgi:hypothetical protein
MAITREIRPTRRLGGVFQRELLDERGHDFELLGIGASFYELLVIRSAISGFRRLGRSNSGMVSMLSQRQPFQVLPSADVTRVSDWFGGFPS